MVAIESTPVELVPEIIEVLITPTETCEGRLSFGFLLVNFLSLQNSYLTSEQNMRYTDTVNWLFDTVIFSL